MPRRPWSCSLGHAVGLWSGAVRDGSVHTAFFRDIERRFRGCGSKSSQFSQAYVIAHEVGHRVQNLLGVPPKVQETQGGMDKVEANQLQVRVELQADHAEEQWRFIEPGDVEAAMQTASAIGHDRVQRQSQGYVVPDAFTHGTSEQRTRWFMTGLKSGQIEGCDTFRAAPLQWRCGGRSTAPFSHLPAGRRLDETIGRARRNDNG
jgi:uncharacterized protein